MHTTPTTPQKSTNGRIGKRGQDLGHRLVRGAFGTVGRLAPRSASALAERVFLAPPRHRAPTREEWWATDAEPFEVPCAGGALAAWSWGWGPRTVVLVHGWGGRGLQLGAFAAPLVDAGFRVVAFDGPGHGRSPGRTSSLPAMANAVATLARRVEAGGGRVAGVVAHSFGAAATSVALADSASELSEARLVYVAPPADFRLMLRRFGELTGFPEPVVAGMRRRIEGRFGILFDELQPLALAPSMERPLTVVHDRFDREIPWREGATLARAWPGAVLRTTEGLGHYRVLRDVGVVERAVAALRDDEVASRAA